MLHISNATLDDASHLCEASTLSFDDDARRFFGIDAGGPPGYNDLEYHIKLIEGHVYNDPYVYYKIVWNDKIIGGIVVFPCEASCHLGRVFITPEYQNRGVGAQCLAFLDEEYPQATTWTLSTPSCCTRNIHFYEKHGYVKIGEGETDEQGIVEIKFQRLKA